MDNAFKKKVSAQTLRRLPVYLHYLNLIKGEQPNISATAISDALGLNDVQVRKDLGAVSGTGRPRTGYVVTELIGQIEACLGCGSITRAVIVGAGNLGKALLSYNGFGDYGLDIVAAFDRDADKFFSQVSGKPVLPMDALGAFCRDNEIPLGIITVPATAAQLVCDALISHGVTAIWNFAPTLLKVPNGVLVENENLASSLAILSTHLRSSRSSPDLEEDE